MNQSLSPATLLYNSHTGPSVFFFYFREVLNTYGTIDYVLMALNDAPQNFMKSCSTVSPSMNYRIIGIGVAHIWFHKWFHMQSISRLWLWVLLYTWKAGIRTPLGIGLKAISVWTSGFCAGFSVGDNILFSFLLVQLICRYCYWVPVNYNVQFAT